MGTNQVKKEEEFWGENPDTELECVKCGSIWKLGYSVTCPNCDGVEKMEEPENAKL